MASAVDLAMLITVAIAPATIALLLVCRRNSILWLSAFLGGVGWFVALLLRAPAFMALNALVAGSSLQYIRAGLAGVFEEPVRYFITKSMLGMSGGESRRRAAVAVGLGWGVAEALVVYVASIALLFLAGEMTGGALDYLAGAIERNSSVIFHTAMALLMLLAVERKTLLPLALAIVIHGLLNVIALVSIAVGLGVGLVETIIFALSALSLALSIALLKLSTGRGF